MYTIVPSDRPICRKPTRPLFCFPSHAPFQLLRRASSSVALSLLSRAFAALPVRARARPRGAPKHPQLAVACGLALPSSAAHAQVRHQIAYGHVAVTRLPWPWALRPTPSAPPD